MVVLLGGWWILWRGGLSLALKARDFVVLVVGEDADERHHAHHFGGPVVGESVSFGFGDDGVHSHFHEGVLREAFDAFGVFGDR